MKESQIDLNNSTLLETGVISNNYLLKDNRTVFEKFITPSANIDIFERMAREKSTSIVLPKDLIYSEDGSLINGLLLEYYSGKRITEIPDELTINELIDICQFFEKDVIKLWENGLIIDNVNQNNLLYTKEQQIIMINPEKFYYSEDDYYKTLLNH